LSPIVALLGPLPDETLAATAPEVLEGGACDLRADSFSIGVSLFEATTGARLFRRRRAKDTLRAVLETEVPPPSLARAGYPPELERIVLSALSRDPAGRPANALDLADALRAFASARLSELDATDELRGMMHECFEAELEARLALERAAIEDARKLRAAAPVPVEIVVGDRSFSQPCFSRSPA
jgi:hypothetical protein